MPLSVGQRLGPYEIRSQIGAGGMGEVYQARDTKLKRDVALKVLPDTFASDPERMMRFQREAEVLASLNHPNIAHIYGIEERALVMELVEGETLPCPVSIDVALNYGKQIAEALEYAHEKGVIHRDLKPANIKITPEGAVKVLDFGLAKAIDDPVASSDPANSPTLTLSATRMGMIMGTAAYMSPEQAVGKPADRRSDIFSFGAVLYEMLSGKRAFAGEMTGDILAAVVKDDPDWRKLPAATPASVRVLLRRCLTKDRKQRLQAIGEARIALENPAVEESAKIVIAPRSRPLGWALVAGLLSIALATLAFVHFRESPRASLQPLRFQIFPPEKTTFEAASALSPDGRHLAFVGRTAGGPPQLWIRDLDSLQTRALGGTEGATFIFWSPDSRLLGFTDGGKLKKIDIAGGVPQLICELPGRRVGQGAWSADGEILFGVLGSGGAGEGLRRVSGAGGSPTVATMADPSHPGEFHDFAAFLSDGRRFLYLRISGNSSGVFSGSLDVRAEKQPDKRLLATSHGFVYVPPVQAGAKDTMGRLLFLGPGGGLVAQAFDEKQLELIGEPAPVADQIGNLAAYGFFTASANGVLAYRAGRETAAQMMWFDRQGNPVGTLRYPGLVRAPAISPDGNTVVVDRYDVQTGTFDLWTHSLVRGTDSRLTFRSGGNAFPVWSPDGSRIAFTSSRAGGSAVYQKAANGVGQEDILDKDAQTKVAYDWSRDGRYLIEGVLDPKTGWDIWVLPLLPEGPGGDQRAFPYLHTESNERNGKLSPDGRWLAYVSDETGRDEVYVQSFSGEATKSRGKWQVSISGGGLPVWSRDGKDLFFIDADRKMTAVEVKSAAGQFEPGVPKPLFETHLGILANTHFDVSKDNRFLIPTEATQSVVTPFTVVVNWETVLNK